MSELIRVRTLSLF